MLFAERTRGKFAARFRRPKKGKNQQGTLSDDNSLATDSQSSSSESFGVLSTTSEGSAGETPLPSLPSRPSFVVDPVAHCPVAPSVSVPQNYMPLLFPPSPKGQTFGSESFPGFIGRDVKWPAPNAVPADPVDFSFLLEAPQLGAGAQEFPDLSAETLARMYPQAVGDDSPAPVDFSHLLGAPQLAPESQDFTKLTVEALTRFPQDLADYSPTISDSDSDSGAPTVPESDSYLLQGLQAFADTYVQEDDGPPCKHLNPEVIPEAHFFFGVCRCFLTVQSRCK